MTTTPGIEPAHDDETLAAEIAQRAGETTVVGVASLGREHVPAGRDRSVGVPIVLCPAGRLFVSHDHSHAALARKALSAAGLPFDQDYPDRTLGQTHGWAMVQAAGEHGLRIQLDRPATHRQRQVLEDLMTYADRSGRSTLVHWGRPVVWSGVDWADNPAFEAANSVDQARRLLARRGTTLPSHPHALARSRAT